MRLVTVEPSSASATSLYSWTMSSPRSEPGWAAGKCTLAEVLVTSSTVTSAPAGQVGAAVDSRAVV